MLQIYRRHTNRCVSGYKQHNRDGRRCTCTIHISGTVGKDHVRQSLKTRDWNQASRILMDAEARNSWHETAKSSKPVLEAYDAFLADAESEKGRALRPATLASYRTLRRKLEAFLAERKLSTLEEITPEHIRQFRDSLAMGAKSAANTLVKVRCFTKFCLQNEWLDKDPTASVKVARAHGKRDAQKLPYTEEEMARLIAAAEGDFEMQTMILLMRTTGLRISDAAFLSTDQTANNYLKIDTRKTGTRISMPLQLEIAERLSRIVLKREKYYFLGQSDRLATATDLWRRRFKLVAKKAAVIRPSLHRLRHSAAVGWLLSGLSTETVAKLLGHSSPAITAKFYSAWVDARQKALDEELRSTWKDAA